MSHLAFKFINIDSNLFARAGELFKSQYGMELTPDVGNEFMTLFIKAVQDSIDIQAILKRDDDKHYGTTMGVSQ